jgi:hypothetical protein
MKKVLVILSMLISLTVNVAFADEGDNVTLVQLNDTYSAQDILFRYNDVVLLTMEGRDVDLHQVYTTPERSKVNDGLVDGTTSWGTVSDQGAKIYMFLNGNGKVSQMIVCTPITIDKKENIEYAYRFLRAIDCRNTDYATMLQTCTTAVNGECAEGYYSQTAKRWYGVSYVLDDTSHSTIISAAVLE